MHRLMGVSKKVDEELECSWVDQVMLDLYWSAQVATGAMWHVESRRERLVEEKSMMVHRVGRTVG